MANLQYLGSTTQRPGETIPYTVDVSNVGSSPTVSSVAIFDTADYDTDLAGTLLTGSNSVSGDVITTKAVTSLTDGKRYRVEVAYTIGNGTYVDYFEILCDDEE